METKIQEYIGLFESVERAILDTVRKSTGIKGTELALKVITLVHPRTFESAEYITILNMLVHSGQILELEYIVPQTSYRIKSIYFPKGTTLRFGSIKIGGTP